MDFIKKLAVLWCSWPLPHIPFSSYSKLHRELMTFHQLSEQAEHVGQGSRYHADVQIRGPELTRSGNLGNSRWLSLSVVNPMGNCQESKICRYHADLQILEIQRVITYVPTTSKTNHWRIELGGVIWFILARQFKKAMVGTWWTSGSVHASSPGVTLMQWPAGDRYPQGCPMLLAWRPLPGCEGRCIAPWKPHLLPFVSWTYTLYQRAASRLAIYSSL